VPTLNLPFVFGFAINLLVLNLDRPKSGSMSLTTSIAMLDFLNDYDFHDVV
jgi:hypothetical protein